MRRAGADFRWGCLAALVVLVAVAAGPASLDARADAHDDPRPLSLPWAALTDLDGAEAALLHAASLAFSPRLELVLFGQGGVRDAEWRRTAFGGALAGRLGPLAAGLGVAAIGGLRDGGALGTRADLALAWRLAPGAAIGAQWRWYAHRDGGPTDAWWSWALSATLRPTRGVALAAQVDRLNAPLNEAGARGEPVARVSLGLRPFGEVGSVTFDAARTLGDGAWEAGLATRWWLTSGVSLGVWGRGTWRDDGVGASPDWSGGLTVGLGQGGLGLEGAVTAAPDGLTGVSVLARARSGTLSSVSDGPPRMLRVIIDGPLPERPRRGLTGTTGPGFANWLMGLERASRDPRVVGILLQIGDAPGWAQCWELREALQRLRARGKKVVASLVGGDMRAMYLAAADDEVWLYAAGSLRLTGLSLTRSYYVDLLRMLGIEAEFIALESYKSFPEIATRSGPSEASDEQTTRALAVTRSNWRAAVAAGRALAPERLDALVAAGPQSMKDALAAGLVDALVEADAYAERLAALVGPHALVTELTPELSGGTRWGTRKAVAVVPVVGAMVDGDSALASPLPLPFTGGPTTGDRTFITALEAAIRDPDVVGVVVRVDSGGGSVTAADRMHRAVLAMSKVKPIIVSFGDVAASGGYYLAAGAGTILASPLTLTGSIGIFTGKANLAGLWSRIGVAQHVTKTDPRADMLGDHRGLTADERARAEEVLRAYYERFLAVVGDGRKLSPEATRAVAQGRVWIGEDALARGLVDGAGGLMDAILAVAQRAGLEATSLDVRYFGSVGRFSGVTGLLAQAGGVGDDAGPTLWPALREFVAALESSAMLAGGALLARMPDVWRID